MGNFSTSPENIYSNAKLDTNDDINTPIIINEQEITELMLPKFEFYEDCKYKYTELENLEVAHPQVGKMLPEDECPESVATFSPENTFERGEIVLVARKGGRYGYGRLIDDSFHTPRSYMGRGDRMWCLNSKHGYEIQVDSRLDVNGNVEFATKMQPLDLIGKIKLQN